MRLLQAIEGYMRTHKIPPSRFGRMAVKDPRLVRDIKRGRTLGPKMVARIERFLAEQAQ